MKYPMGTIFNPPKAFDWHGEVVGVKNSKYQIMWSDGYGNSARYSEKQLDEIIHISLLTWKLPYTINHDFDEELFTV
jgi:hypothetical protein